MLIDVVSDNSVGPPQANAMSELKKHQKTLSLWSTNTLAILASRHPLLPCWSAWWALRLPKAVCGYLKHMPKSHGNPPRSPHAFVLQVFVQHLTTTSLKVRRWDLFGHRATVRITDRSISCNCCQRFEPVTDAFCLLCGPGLTPSLAPWASWPTHPTNTCCLWATSFLAGTAHPRCASPHKD